MPPTNYGHTWGGPSTHELEVPSGSTVLVKRPGVDRLLEAGVIEDVDSLTPFVEQKHVKRVKQGKKVTVTEDRPADDATMLKLMADKVTREKMIALMDKVVEHMVIEPVVRRPVDDQGNFLSDEERIDGFVYTDTIDFMDKAHILKYAVGNPASMERFREQADEPGASV